MTCKVTTTAAYLYKGSCSLVLRGFVPTIQFPSLNKPQKGWQKNSNKEKKEPAVERNVIEKNFRTYGTLVVKVDYS